MLEDASSSPSADPRVVSLEPLGAGGADGLRAANRSAKAAGSGTAGRPHRSSAARQSRGPLGQWWSLGLSDGSCLSFSAESLRLAGIDLPALEQGTQLASSLIERLRICGRVIEARDKAVELLARRAHSAGELRNKLVRRRFEVPVVEEALGLLGERGYLDDRSFAHQWLEQRLERHPEGRPALLAGLRRRGVARKIVEEVVAASFPPELERRCAEALLERVSLREAAAGRLPDRERLRRLLQRRGFGAPLVLDLLREDRWGPRRDDRPGEGSAEPGAGESG